MLKGLKGMRDRGHDPDRQTFVGDENGSISLSTWMNWMVMADFPTPPPPTTTIL